MRISDWSSDVCSSDLVAGHDLQAVPAAPGVGVADLGQEGAQLFQRPGLGLVAHPGQAFDARLERVAHVVDHLLRTGLGRGREVFFKVQLAKCLSHAADRRRTLWNSIYKCSTYWPPYAVKKTI